MLLSHVWHFSENELAREGPEEGLDGELVHVAELKAHGDIVIVLDALDLAPELELLRLNSRLEGVESHLNLHPLVQIESGAVVTEVLNLLTEVQNVHFCYCLFNQL